MKETRNWAEYIRELCADDRPALPSPSNDRGPTIMKAEVRKAIKNTQSGKAPGDDGITTDMLDEFGIDS